MDALTRALNLELHPPVSYDVVIAGNLLSGVMGLWEEHWWIYAYTDEDVLTLLFQEPHDLTFPVRIDLDGDQRELWLAC